MNQRQVDGGGGDPSQQLDSQNLEHLNEDSAEDASDSSSALLEKQRRLHVSAGTKEQMRRHLLAQKREGGGVAQADLIEQYQREKQRRKEMAKLGYRARNKSNEKSLMGGVNEFLATVKQKQNAIFETGSEAEKQHEALKIYQRIYKQERQEAEALAQILDKDMNTWLARNESYANPRTA